MNPEAGNFEVVLINQSRNIFGIKCLACDSFCEEREGVWYCPKCNSDISLAALGFYAAYVEQEQMDKAKPFLE